MTALDIITDAMQMVGELAQGQTPSPEDGAFCLRRLNNILDSWSQQEDYIFTRSIGTYALTNGVGTYAIGLTAASPFNVARPNKIDMARILGQITGSSAVDVGLRVLRIINYAEYVEHADKNSTSIIPEELYYDNAMPNGNLYLFDKPAGTGLKLELTVWSQLAQFTSLAGTYGLPPGYLEPLTLALGEAISPGYNKAVDPVTAARGVTYSQRLRDINHNILKPGMPPREVMPGSTPGQPAAPPPIQ